MSSRTSSRSTLTTVPSTMSPSLKYLIVSSIAARKASSEPMSSTAILLPLPDSLALLLAAAMLSVAEMLLVMWEIAPVMGIVGLRYPGSTRPDVGDSAADYKIISYDPLVRSLSCPPARASGRRGPAPSRDTQPPSPPASLPSAIPQGPTRPQNP